MSRRKVSEQTQARRFAVILTFLLGGLAGFSLYRQHPLRAAILSALAVLAPGLAFLATPLWLRLFRLWMKLAQGMSWVSTRVILSVFYYAVLTPFGLVQRLRGRAPLDLAFGDGRSTYWVDKTAPEASLERYRKSY